MEPLKKIRSRAGFTLAETLLAVLILLLVSGIVATGVPVAQNVYNKVVRGANAQSLLSTTVAALRDELGTAWNVQYIPEKVPETSITYYSSDTGAKSMLYLGEKDNGEEDNKIYIQEYQGIDVQGSNPKEGGKHLLVSAAAATDKLLVTYTGITSDNNVVTITGLAVCDENSTSVKLAELGDLKIEVFSTKPLEGGD